MDFTSAFQVFVNDIDEDSVDAGCDAYDDVPVDKKLNPKVTADSRSLQFGVHSAEHELDVVDFLESTLRDITSGTVDDFCSTFLSFGCIPRNGFIIVTPSWAGSAASNRARQRQ